MNHIWHELVNVPFMVRNTKKVLDALSKTASLILQNLIISNNAPTSPMVSSTSHSTKFTRMLQNFNIVSYQFSL